VDRLATRWSRRQVVQAVGLAGLGLLGGCGRLPWQTQSPARLARVGVLSPYGADDASSAAMIEPLREGLRERGYLEGQNVILETRFSDGQNERLPELAAELIRLPVDVIVADKHDAIMAAKQGTTTIPVVISTHADPVGSGLVASLARPGGNVTGVSTSAVEIGSKRLELLHQVAPGTSRVAILSDHTYAPTQRLVEEAEFAARTLGLDLLALDVRAPADFAAAFEATLRAGTHALVVFGDPLSSSQRGRILDFAAQNRLPTIYQNRPWVEAGGLMSYGANNTALYRRSAYYVDRILKGTRPEDLPVEQPMTFDFVVNMNTAQALGLTLPQEILLQIMEVLE
jgi:putative tryptophan/tyrosine transport system substrate-binding protein